MIRRAEEKDMDRVLELLVQVNMVHHLARPDLFNGPATKYTREELRDIFRSDDTPVFVWTDYGDRVQGYAFCIMKQAVNDHILTDIRTLSMICAWTKRCAGSISERNATGMCWTTPEPADATM